MKTHIHPRHAEAAELLAVVLSDAFDGLRIALFLRTLCAFRLACAGRGVGVS
jgi:hypothetical protein